jgi:selenoprotein W-related protein
MTTVEIEYCVPRSLLEPAIKTERALLEEFGRDVKAVTLRPGHGGIFEIRIDNETVWGKDTHGGELDLNLIKDAVRQSELAA